MSDIFISYEKSDRRTAEMLAQKLLGYGWTTFWDRTIIIGQDWHEKIEQELTNARCVVVLWSKASIKSGWVRDEAREAIRRGVFVPVLIGNIDPPLGFRNIQAGDLTNWDGTESAAFHRLIVDLAALIGSSPKEVEGEVGLAEEVEGKAEKERERDEGETKNVKAAKDDDADAMYDLGVKHLRGEGVEIDFVKARKWFKKAAAKGHVEAMFNLGEFYYYGRGVAQHYSKAREWFEKSAAKDHVEAMFNLGEFYYYGRTVGLHYGKARELYEKVAAKGHSGAMFCLGRLYHYGGEGVKKDLVKAREWYEKAAAKDDAAYRSRAEEALTTLPSH